MKFLKSFLKKFIPLNLIFIGGKVINPDKKFETFDGPEFLNYVAKKKLGIELRKNSIKTLAIRGSGTDYAIYADLSNDLYNLGLTSSDLYTSFHLYNNTYHLLPNLKNIILVMNVMAPGYSLIKTKERYRAVAYKYFFAVDYQDKNSINPKIEKRIFDQCKKFLLKKLDTGYQGYERKEYFGTHISANNRIVSHIRENKREPDQMIWIKKMSDLAKINGHRLFIVIPPFREDYKKILPSCHELFEKIYSGGFDVEIINFYDSPLFSDDDMGDTDHLNERGAKKFTHELLKIINSY